MKKIRFSSIVFLTTFSLAALSLTGCASTPPAARENPGKHSSPIPSKQQNSIKTRLLQHFQAWRGTPYRYGGISKTGVDCSGFIYITYREVFGRELPRSTELLVDVGMTIPKSQLQVGDLVFFKTRLKQRHIGLYMGQGKFIHASTSKGVIISSLDSAYWKNHYWMSRRLS